MRPAIDEVWSDDVRTAIADDVGSMLGVANAVAAFQSVGSTGRARVDEQLQTWRKKLDLP